MQFSPHFEPSLFWVYEILIIYLPDKTDDVSMGQPPLDAVRRWPVKALFKFLWLKNFLRDGGGVANDEMVPVKHSLLVDEDVLVDEEPAPVVSELFFGSLPTLAYLKSGETVSCRFLKMYKEEILRKRVVVDEIKSKEGHTTNIILDRFLDPIFMWVILFLCFML